jgi:hypothetical protein
MTPEAAMTAIRWARLVVVLILLALAPAPAGAQGTLYSISSDFTFDPVTNAPITFLRRIDPATGQTLSSVPISMVNPPPPLHTGDPRNTFVLSGNGLAVHPQTGQLFAILTVESEADETPPLPVRHLATIDPATGLATLIGDPTTRMAGLTFTTGGALGPGVLLAVSGDNPQQGPNCPPPTTLCQPSTLYRMDPTSAHATLLKNFNTFNDEGEVIAFDLADLRLYHASGITSPRFESVDLGALGSPVTPIPLTGFQNSEITALLFSQGLFFAADFDQNLLTITPAGVVSLIGPLDHKSKGLAFIAPPPPTTLVAAVLPSSRSVQVPTTATAFATIINSGGNPAIGVGISLATAGIPAAFKYNVTDCATNAVIGADNAPVNIAPGAAACYVLSITPASPFDPTEVAFNFAGINTAPVTTLVAINTLLMSASLDPVPDIVALAATATNDGIVHVPGAGGAAAFAVATSNVGAGDTITVSANTGGAVLPVALSLCQTNPVTSACISPIGPSVPVVIGAGAIPTFGIFVSASAPIPLDPANSRVFVVFTDSGGIVRGRTSVAVTTL